MNREYAEKVEVLLRLLPIVMDEKVFAVHGGSACNIHEEEMQQEPRATKDIDLVLIVEALSDAFVQRFWEFIKTGGYEQRQRGESAEEETERKHEYFRFIKPTDKSFPKQIELFSRNLGLMDIPEDAHITPIPAGEDLSSLSAILMDDDEQVREILSVPEIKQFWEMILRQKAFLEEMHQRIAKAVKALYDFALNRDLIFSKEAEVSIGNGIIA